MSLFRPKPRGPAPVDPYAEGLRECDPAYTLGRNISRARREMGETRWAELEQEWNEVVPPAIVEARNEAAYQRLIREAIAADRRSAEWDACKELAARKGGVR